MDVRRIARFVRGTAADAWVVVGGSRDVLEWFASQSFPSFALFGRHRRVSMASAGPDKVPAYRESARRLIELGHRRISLLVGEDRRRPSPGTIEQAFLDEMEAAGIPTGAYNLPHWPMHDEGFRRCIDSLFERTPPTALLVDRSAMFHAAMHHLAQRDILAPRDVSLICTDPDLTFAWCKPSIAHILWDSRPVVRRVVRWADNIARGRDDLRKSFTKASFIEGGTIGPVPMGR
jgi:DNA-binding LacI/PurR family transcriptional regulator